MKNGTIRWFDSLSGKGVIRGENGESYYLHFTAIQGINKNNYQWPTDEDQLKLKTINGLNCSYELTYYGITKLVLKSV